MKLAKYIGQQVLDMVKHTVTEPLSIYSYQVRMLILLLTLAGDDKYIFVLRGASTCELRGKRAWWTSLDLC
jgi:hypothetical protein